MFHVEQKIIKGKILMISNPKIGQNVVCWYRKSHKNKYHGKSGVVIIRSSGKPRNHAVDVGGVVVVVPCGNLQSPDKVA